MTYPLIDDISRHRTRSLQSRFGPGLVTLITLTLSLCLPSISSAGLIYEFNDFAGTPTTTFTTTIGGTVDISVYLKEVGTTVLFDEELFGASLRVTFDSPGGIAGVQNVSDIFPNVGFTDLTPGASISAIGAGFTGSVGLDPFLTPDGANRIFLGTFRFTGLSAGSVDLFALDRDLLSDDTVTGLFTILDGSIGSGTAQLTVTASAVPEPSSCMVLIVAIFCVIWHRGGLHGRQLATLAAGLCQNARSI